MSCGASRLCNFSVGPVSVWLWYELMPAGRISVRSSSCRLLVTQSCVNRLCKSSPNLFTLNQPHGGCMHIYPAPRASPHFAHCWHALCSDSKKRHASVITRFYTFPPSHAWAAGWEQGSLNRLQTLLKAVCFLRRPTVTYKGRDCTLVNTADVIITPQGVVISVTG